MPPVCTDCGVFMRCAKNGYVVGFQTGRRYDSDQYQCPECGVRVAILAQAPHKEPPANGEPIKADCMMREDQ